MIDYVVGAEIADPIDGFRARCGTDHGELSQLACELDQNGTDPAAGQP